MGVDRPAIGLGFWMVDNERDLQVTLTPAEHYQEFLSRIQTVEDFRKEIRGKLEAIRAVGFPMTITAGDIDFLCSVLPMNTLGKPQFWPPIGEGNAARSE